MRRGFRVGSLVTTCWWLALPPLVGCSGDDDGIEAPEDASTRDDSSVLSDAAKTDTNLPEQERDALSEDSSSQVLETGNLDAQEDSARETSANDGAESSVADATDGRAPIDCPPGVVSSTLLASGLNPDRAVAHGSNIYFLRPGTAANNYLDYAIQSLPKSGGSPLTIVGPRAQISDLAVDGVNVYFTTPGAVFRCALGGCGNAPTPIATVQTNPSRIVTDGNAVYYTTDSAIMKCSVAGCGSSATLFANFGSGRCDIAADSTRLYWTNQSGGMGGTISSCPLAGCLGSPTILAQDQEGPFGISTDGTRVVWETAGTSASLVACSAGGCGGAPTVLAAAQGAASGLGAYSGTFVGEDQVYWEDDVRIFRCAAGGCNSTSTQIAISPLTSTGATSTPIVVASDATGFYWLTRATAGMSDGTLRKCPPCGCGGAPLNAVNDASDHAADVVTDGTNVWWIDDGYGTGSQGRLFVCTMANCANTARLIYQAPSNLSSLLSFGRYLYFFEGNTLGSQRTLQSLPKPASVLSVAIGGTLVGLPGGASIELQNKGGDALTLTTDGAFRFATQQPIGTKYKVAVSKQPVGRTCKVGGATGTTGVADVGSVVVNCLPTKFTVGGAVSSLFDDTIVLQINGGETVTVAGESTFAFATPLGEADSYDVSVLRKPNFAGMCFVVNGSRLGFDGGPPTDGGPPDVTSIAVTCIGPTGRQAGPTSSALSTDGQFLYWVQGGTLANGNFVNGAAVRMPIDGGPIEVLASGINNVGASSLVLDTTYLYFSAFFGGVIYKVPVAGGTATPIATGETNPTSLALNGSTLYWANDTHIVNLDLTNGGVPTAIAASPAIAFRYAVSYFAPPRRLVISGSNLFWVSLGQPYEDSVQRAGLLGENPLAIATGQGALGGGVSVVGRQVLFTATRPALMSASW